MMHVTFKRNKGNDLKRACFKKRAFYLTSSRVLRYFVVSVLIQRNTGGNLAEILENISRLIRARIKFQGKVRVLSAEGKLSAVVLIALPFLIVLVLSFLKPQYIQVLWTEHAGRIMAGVAVIMMIFGALVMKKIVTLEV